MNRPTELLKNHDFDSARACFNKQNSTTIIFYFVEKTIKLYFHSNNSNNALGGMPQKQRFMRLFVLDVEMYSSFSSFAFASYASSA